MNMPVVGGKSYSPDFAYVLNCQTSKAKFE
jgi:restriction endonuclease